MTWKFLTDPDVGPWTRMRRASRGTPASEQQAPAQAVADEKAAAMVRCPLLVLSFWCNS